MQPQVVIYACQQAVLDPDALRRQWGGGEFRLLVVLEPCSSKVEAFQLLRTLATPVELVWVIGCREENCQYQEGSRRLRGRVTYTQRYLEEIGLEPERLGHTLVTPGDQASLAAILADIKARAQALGPSPLRRHAPATQASQAKT
jgi:F420-non-reducing hydrogenase iron-sulfur subunit